MAKDKKGKILLGEVMFVALNLIVASLLLVFIFRASSGALIYEQAYAKQIGLILDNSHPVMKSIKIDLSKGIEIAKKNFGRELTPEEKNNLVFVGGGKVVVRFSPKGGYEFKYFSDYKVKSYFDKNFLILIVEDKNGMDTE